MMAEIILTTGQVTLVSEEDLDFLNQWNWYYLSKDNVAIAVTEVGSTIRMSRLVAIRMGLNLRLEIDHKNLDTLDNQRENLREATRSQNAANRLLQSNNTSGYKGVDFIQRLNKFRSRIKVRKNEIHLGVFKTDIEAASAYNRAAIHYFGEFANLNEVPDVATR